jgi:ABC-2 type transport system ATP-binding protein
MIEVEQVSKHFEQIEALHDVTMQVRKGSIYGLVGSNGAGKTTLLKILAGLYRQDSGAVRVDAEPIYENNEVKARLVFISDNLYWFLNFTVEDMANFYRSIYSRWDQERYSKLGAAFEIDPRCRLKTLSKGMQRQVAFWLGLSLTPDILILDEPLDGLDPVMRQKVKNLIVQDVAAREMTVLISSHNLRDLEGICDQIGILHHGQMLIQKDPDDLQAGLHKIQAAFSGGIPEALLQEEPVLSWGSRNGVLTFIASGSHEEIVRQMQAYGPALLDVLPLTLEEIFIYEMGENGYDIKSILY